MQMFPSAAPGIACNPDNITRQNVLPLWYGDLRQVTITDGKATVLDSNIFPGHLILSNSKDSPLHHGKYLGTSGMEVNTIVKLPLPREWVFPITVRRIYLDMWERIAYAEIASYLLFLFCVSTWQWNLVGYGLFIYRGDAFGCRLCFVCRPGGIFNSDFIAIARKGNRVELRFHMVPG